MINVRHALFAGLLLAGLATSAFAQKTKVGYDKSADFSKYKTYTWAPPSMPPSRPMLYAMIVESIDHELKNVAGLERTDKDGDLILIAIGGMEFGINLPAGTPILPTYGAQPAYLDATMWTGYAGVQNRSAPYVQEGALQLQFVERSANRLVWDGTLTDKLDMGNDKNKSLDRIDKGIAKLLKQFPPKGTPSK